MNRHNDEMKSWNWAAFLLTWIWGVPHRVWVSLLALIPGLNILLAIFLGMYGNRLAWKSNKQFTIAEFKHNQKLWLKWAGLFYLTMFICGSAVVLITAYSMHKSDEMSGRDAIRLSNVHSVINAINRYKLNHDGKCPERLNVLEVNYIESLPTAYGEYLYSVNGEVCKVSIKLENSLDVTLRDDADPSNGNIFDQTTEDYSSTTIFGED